MDLPEPLVMADWLTNALNADPSSLVVADVRWYPDGSARRRFESGHIPAAVFVDVDRDLSAPVREDRVGGRHHSQPRRHSPKPCRGSGSETATGSSPTTTCAGRTPPGSRGCSTS